MKRVRNGANGSSNYWDLDDMMIYKKVKEILKIIVFIIIVFIIILHSSSKSKN